MMVAVAASRKRARLWEGERLQEVMGVAAGSASAKECRWDATVVGTRPTTDELRNGDRYRRRSRESSDNDMKGRLEYTCVRNTHV